MKYRPEIWNSANDTRLAILSPADAPEAWVSEEVNGQDIVEFDIDVKCDKWQHVTYERFIRIVDTTDTSTANFKSYRISEIKDARTKDNKLLAHVTAERCKYDLLKDILEGETFYTGALPDTILTTILDGSGFTKGTVNPAATVDFEIKWENRLSALDRLAELCSAEVEVTETWDGATWTKYIHLKTTVGANNNVEIRYQKNLEGIERQCNPQGLVNKLFPIGNGEPALTLGKSEINDGAMFTLPASGSHSTTKAIMPAGVIMSDDSFVGDGDPYPIFYLKRIRGELVGVHAITDSDASDPSFTTGAFTEGEGGASQAGDIVQICSDSAGETPIKYIEDKTSITAYGTREGVEEFDLEDIQNHVTDPTLSGTYASGLCAGYTKVGGPTLSEDSTYIQRGTKSQKVECTTYGDGVSQVVSGVTVSQYYSLKVVMYIAAGGKVFCQIKDGTAILYPSNEEIKAKPDDWCAGGATAGWWEYTVQMGDVLAGALTVQVLGYDSSTTFYVDSMQVTKGHAPREGFTDGNTADDLWAKGYAQLSELKDPQISYRVDCKKLFEIDSHKYQYDDFDNGDTIQVKDTDLGIDVSVRIQKLRWSVWEPWDVTLELDNKVTLFSEHMTDVSTNIRMLNKKERSHWRSFGRIEAPGTNVVKIAKAASPPSLPSKGGLSSYVRYGAKTIRGTAKEGLIFSTSVGDNTKDFALIDTSGNLFIKGRVENHITFTDPA